MDERENWLLSTEYKNFQQAPSPFPQQILSREQYVNNGLQRLRVFESTRRFGVDAMLAETNIPLMTLHTWERIYGIPSPRSDEHHQKLYSQRDIAAVRWLCEQVTSSMSLCQAVVELVRYEPAYANDRVSSVLLPPIRELPELRDKLMQAVVSMNMANAIHILADAFIMHPATVICESLLRPVFAYTVELRKRAIIPLTTETVVARLIQSQVPRLIEACFSPKDASAYLSSLLLQVSQSDEMKQQEKITRAVPDLDKMGEPLLEALGQMNKTIALRILDSAFHYYSVEDVCLFLLQPVLSHIRALSDTNTIPTAIKDFSITLVYKYLFFLFQTTPNLRKGLLILVCDVPLETYEIDALMLALFWRRAGLHIHYHGRLSGARDLPEVLETIRPLHPGIIYLSATRYSRIHDVKEVGQEIARLKHPRPIFCFGGNAFDGNTILLSSITGVYLGLNVTTHMQRLGEVIRLYPGHSPGQIEDLLSTKALLTNFQEESETSIRLRVREEHGGSPNGALFSVKTPERASPMDVHVGSSSGATHVEMFPKEDTYRLPATPLLEPGEPSDNAVVYNGKGDALFARKLYREALEAYEQAVSLDPNNAAAYNGKGNALSGLELYREAEKAYQHAERLANGPSVGRW